MGELETINTSITTLDTRLKGLTSLQTKAKTKIGNSSEPITTQKPMATQTQHESSRPPTPTPSPPRPPRSSLTPAQQNTSSNTKDTEILDKDKGNLYIIMDPNRKFINFKEVLTGEFNNELTPIVIPCGNIRKAESILNSAQISTRHVILLHIGINDLDDQGPEDIALDLKELAECFQNKFNCEVSGVTRREDDF